MKDKLIKLLDNSYAPYSNMHFACIVETENGSFYEGVNVENASYGACICAERSATLSAVSAGYKKGDFRELHVMCLDSKTISTPCFMCRQVISELFKSDAFVTCYSNTGDTRKYKVSELCPYPFSEEDLK